MAKVELGKIITAVQRRWHSPGRGWSFVRNYNPREHNNFFPEVDMHLAGEIQDFKAYPPAFDEKTGRKLPNEIAVYIKKRTRSPLAQLTQEIQEHSK